MKKENRIYINDTTYLTERGENVIGAILLTGLIALLFAVVGLINIHFLTPQECRDGFFDIKTTTECSKHRLG